MADLLLNRYQPISTAGEGGFGTVIVAWDTRIRRKVAIKCIQLRDSYATPTGETINISKATQKLGNQGVQGNQSDANGEVWAEDLPGLAEARTAAMIQDANIVTVYDFELANNTAYIIMEYVEGQTLSQFLSLHSDDLTLDMLTCIFAGVSHAISVAHAENVLHLDIKPDNVIIDKKGKVKVTDFGLATLADEFGYGTADAGTIGYMPPEQIRQQNLDVRTDQWSLASITYEMLAGTNPFDAKDIKGSLENIYDREIACPSEFWEDLDPVVDDIVFGALCPDMTKRFVSVAAFSEGLIPYLGNARSGQRQISELIRADAGAVVEGSEGEPGVDERSFFEKVTSSLSSKILSRVAAFVLSLLTSYFAMCDCGFFSSTLMYFTPNLFAIVAMCCCGIGACIFPFVGVTLSFGLWAACLIINGQILTGVIGCIVVLLWTVYALWKRPVNYSVANCANTYLSLNNFNFGGFSCMISGIFGTPIDAVVNSVFGAYVCLISPMIVSNNYIDANIWIVAVSWICCAVVISGFFEFRKRGLSILGTCIGFAFLIGGICLGNYLSSNMLIWQPSGEQILPATISFIISLILVFFLPNRQPKPQD